MAMLSSLLFAACGGGGGGTPPAPPPPPPPAPQSQFDVVYGSGLTNGGSKALTLDLYQSGAPCTQARPFVMLIHGGGFTGGDKAIGRWPSYAEEMTDRGYVALSINYRLQGDQPLPSAEFTPIRDGILAALEAQNDPEALSLANTISSAFEDTVRSLRWVEENAGTHCIDPSTFALWGGSAGSYIALAVAYGMDDFSIAVTKPKVVIDEWGSLIIPNAMTDSDPPLFILHGQNDTVVPYDLALQLQQEADAVGLPYSFYTVSNGGHGFDTRIVTVDDVPIFELEARFIDAHFSGANAEYETRTIPLRGG
mgnify:CR=1 FL=1|jgi:acetyl esterase/lipase